MVYCGGKRLMKKYLMPIVWFMILFILIFQLFYNLYMLIDYNKRKESGNERWKQVEERIKKLEEEHGRYCQTNN